MADQDQSIHAHFNSLPTWKVLSYRNNIRRGGECNQDNLEPKGLSCEGRWRLFMHFDNDTGKTIGQYGQNTIQEPSLSPPYVISITENLTSWKAVGVRIQDVLEVLASWL